MLGQPFSLPGQAPSANGIRLCHLLSDEALLRRLPGITGEDCVSALRTLNLPDSFWTDEFKVVPCAKTYSHKWTLCPCAHIGETARRRCPRTVNYKAVLCPLVKAKKTCPLGESCSYAHNVFEHWLHPSRYKTRLCSFGRNCNRSICFFAHSAEELRCVPCTEDKESDEREYLMQIIMAQENGLLPSNSLEPVQSAAMPPLVHHVMPDLNSALQQAMQQPLPSNRPSMSGIPETAAIISARASMSGASELLSSRAPLQGFTDATNAAALRASMSNLPDTPGIMAAGRPSLNGLPDRASFLQARTSMNGGQDGMVLGRTSVNSLPDATSMLLSMSMQGSMQRAVSSDVNNAINAAAMQRAMSNDLSAPYNAAATAMRQALSSDLGGPGAPLNAATAAMERAYSREFSSGAGYPTPRDATAAAGAAVVLERALSGNRTQSRRNFSFSSNNQSINSVESDSLLQLRSGIAATSASQLPCMGSGGCAMGFESVVGPPPPRLSDPGLNVHHLRASDSGKQLGLLGSGELLGLESLLPLVNNALATGALSLPLSDVHRNNSGMSGGQVRSSPLQDTSPMHSGSLTPLSSASAVCEQQSGFDGGSIHLLHFQPPLLQQDQQQPHHDMQPTMFTAGSPSRATDGLIYDGTYPLMPSTSGTSVSGGSSGCVHASNGVPSGANGNVDLTELVARLQDQGMNKEQLVSSLSQLLAQLLSVNG